MLARFVPKPLALLVSGALSLVAGAAEAGQSCKLDSDCDHGFACQVVGGTACASPACAPNTNCPPTPPCDPQEIKECVPGPCQAHSDCATGMVCFAVPSTNCTSPAPAWECPPGADCAFPPPSPPDCTTTTMNTCVPLYELPCTTDASCGEGFTCVQDPEACACGGSTGPSVPGDAPGAGTSGSGQGGAPSGGTPANPSGTATPPAPVPDPAPSPPAGCSCTPSTTKHCTPKATSCELDSDCPATWTCATTGGSGCASGAEVLPDGGFKVLPTTCPPPTVTKQCEPPNYGSYGIGRAEAGSVGIGTTGSAGSANSGTGTVVPPTASIPGSAGSTSGTSSGTPSGTDKGTGGGSSSATSDGAPTTSSDNSSCQMGTGHAGTTGASIVGLLGVAGLLRRRRTRWG